jgi:hypothetical protein
MDPLWQVDDEARVHLIDGAPKGRWYDVLGTLALESLPALDAEESVATWDYQLRDQPYPGSVLFAGEMHTAQDGFDDPNVSFIGKRLVKELATWLSLNRDAIQVAVADPRMPNPMWLYEPITRFFASAAERDKAIIVLWEGPTKW